MHTDGGEVNRVHRLKAMIPLQRYGAVDDVAQVIYWLLYEHSTYSIGTFIDLSGGR